MLWYCRYTNLGHMKITLESTTKTVELNGVPARIWEGHTANGIKIHAYITRVAAPLDADQGEFQKELESHKAPSPEIEAIPLRMIIWFWIMNTYVKNGNDEVHISNNQEFLDFISFLRSQYNEVHITISSTGKYTYIFEGRDKKAES